MYGIGVFGSMAMVVEMIGMVQMVFYCGGMVEGEGRKGEGGGV